MFKLKKIINSGVNVPEPELCSVYLSHAVKAGSALHEESGTIGLGNSEAKPTYIAINDIPKGSSKALCYRITPDMIFEVPLRSEYAESQLIGVSLGLLDNGKGYIELNDSPTENCAFLYDLNGARNDGDTVLVKFN